ncbi:MAG: LptA/OstA family protein, partial [Candidatus Omnitrophica bacterium]|nr:LptA/OstA family protein [Candidatus Omnitrophota bacterium]
VCSAHPAVFSAERAKPVSTPVKSPAKTKNVKRVPVQDIFSTGPAKVEAVADSLEYSKDSGKMIARGNAVITYQGTRILADYAEVETDAKKAYARGHVMIFKDDKPRLQGEEIYYDFGNHTGSFPNARVMNDPWYARGEDIQQVREGVSKVRSGSVTTCNLDKPHYEIRCKKATLYANEKLIMYNATLYVLGKPVFWFPWMDVPLNWPNIPVQAKAGYNTDYGAYLELVKGVTINKYLWGKVHIDWRSKKGFGAGWDQFYDFGKYAKGSLQLYLTQDKQAPTPGLGDPYATREDRKRGRITWRHRTDINENTNVILRYNRLADNYFLQDFFEEEFHSETQPHSFVTGTHNTERYGAMIHLEKKMNSFETLVERMPEVRLDWKNQPFYKELVFNESRVQFDSLNLISNPSGDSSTFNSQKAIRTDGYSRWYMPLKWNEIKLMPFVGYRGTEYSHQLNSSDARYRNAFEYGADLRTHFYRLYDVSFDKIGIEVNQLRHILEPSVTFKGTNSTVTNQNLIHFDTVDVLDDGSEVVVGLANRLQTKRVLDGKTQRVDIVSLNTFVHFETSQRNSSVQNSTVTNLDNELTLRPYEWLQFRSRIEYDFEQKYLKFANNDMQIRKGPLKFIFGQRYEHAHYDWYTAQQLQDSEQFTFEARYKINHLWEVGGYTRWDTSNRTSSDGAKMQEWQISAIRDLHDFTFEFGYDVENSLIKKNAKKLFFVLRMKNVPFAQVGSGGSHTEFSEPRIGETVAGANESKSMAGFGDILALQ